MNSFSQKVKPNERLEGRSPAKKKIGETRGIESLKNTDEPALTMVEDDRKGPKSSSLNYGYYSVIIEL